MRLPGFGLVVAGMAAIAGLAAGTASAQGLGQGQWYLKGFGGATWPQDQSGDVKSGGTPSTDGDADYDAGYTLGAAVGYDFTPSIALELEYAYRNADTHTEIVGVDTYGGRTNSNAVMLNAVYNYNTPAAWTPYVGAGLGWANLESDIDEIGSFQRDNAFAWQLFGGVGYDLNPNWSLLGEIRYFQTDSGTLDGPDDLSWDAKLETFEFLVGAVYRF